MLKRFSFLIISVVCFRGLSFGDVSLQPLISSSDDTTRIQAVINQVTAAGGGRISLAEGTYSLTQALVIAKAKNIELIGDGSVTIKQLTKGTSAIIIKDSSDITVKGLKFEGPHGANGDHKLVSHGTGILVGGGEGASHILFSDLEVKGFNYSCIGISGVFRPDGGSARNEFITIQNSQLRDCASGIFVYKNSHHLIIKNNTVEDTWLNGIGVDTRSESDPKETLSNSDIKITNNTIRRSGLFSGDPEPRTPAIGIVIKGKNSDVTVADNTIEDIGGLSTSKFSTSYGIVLINDASGEGGDSIQIIHNTINRVRIVGREANTTNYPADAYGIFASPKMKNVDIQQNKISDVANSIKVPNGSDIRVGSNDISRSPRPSPPISR